jgi:hypothetical protein
MDVDKLEQVAQQLIARVRDDDPQSNRRWLHLLTTEDEREALIYILAAAVPDDRTWRQLTAWTRMPDPPEVIAERRRVLDEALRGGRGRRAA